MWQRLKFWRQFSLKTLLLGMFVAAVACGAYRLGYNAGTNDRLARQGADFDTLIDLITSTIAPTTWEGVGGAGSIDSFSTNCGGCFVIDSSVDADEPFGPAKASSKSTTSEEAAHPLATSGAPIPPHPDDPFR